MFRIPYDRSAFYFVLMEGRISYTLGHIKLDLELDKLDRSWNGNRLHRIF
jgi:hypothetical protein